MRGPSCPRAAADAQTAPPVGSVPGSDRGRPAAADRPAGHG
ncbi:MAG: hypothetical protein V9H69_20040 [Anaerolineae bacterium]